MKETTMAKLTKTQQTAVIDMAIAYKAYHDSIFAASALKCLAEILLERQAQLGVELVSTETLLKDLQKFNKKETV